MKNTTRFADCSVPRSENVVDPFEARFGVTMPLPLRSETVGMNWSDFVERYCPSSGPIRLGSWIPLGAAAGLRAYEATLSVDEHMRTARFIAPGPIAALSAALYDAGYGIEVLAFHQQGTAEGTATFAYCEYDGRRHWAVSISTDSTDSALRAIVAAANILSRPTVRRPSTRCGTVR